MIIFLMSSKLLKQYVKSKKDGGWQVLTKAVYQYYVDLSISLHQNARASFLQEKDATNDATNRCIFWRFFGYPKMKNPLISEIRRFFIFSKLGSGDLRP